MDWEIGSVATASMPNGRGSGGKKMGWGRWDRDHHVPPQQHATVVDMDTVGIQMLEMPVIPLKNAMARFVLIVINQKAAMAPSAPAASGSLVRGASAQVNE